MRTSLLLIFIIIRITRPERLIQESELPEAYTMEHESQVIVDEIFVDGARRARTQVQYDDGLSEEQWLVVSSRDCQCLRSLLTIDLLMIEPRGNR